MGNSAQFSNADGPNFWRANDLRSGNHKNSRGLNRHTGLYLLHPPEASTKKPTASPARIFVPPPGKAQLIAPQAVPSILAAGDRQVYSGKNHVQVPICRFAIFTSAWVNRAQSGRVLGPLHARQMAAGLEVIARSAHPDAPFGHTSYKSPHG